jgi:tetratricopeptide (TPR) repeat protein
MFLALFCLIALTGCGGGKRSKSPVSPKVEEPKDQAMESALSERYLKIRAALDRKDFRGAEKLSLKVVEKTPDDHQARFLLARSLIGLDKPGSAQNHLEKALAIQPDNPAYKRLLGEILHNSASEHIKADRMEKAIDTWKRCLTLKYQSRETEENLMEAYAMWGLKLREEKNPQQAEEIYREGMSLFPQSSTLNLALADLLLSSDRLLEAQLLLQKTNEAFPKLEKSRFTYAGLLYRMGDVRGALRELEALLAFAPGNQEAINLKAQLQNEIPITQMATQIHDFADGEEPPAEVIERLAVMESAGDLQGQILLLQEFRASRPTAHWATLREATLLEKLGRPKDALNLLEGYLRERPDDERAHFLTARCRQLSGDFAGALSLLQAMISDRKANQQVFLEIGQVLAKMGKFDEARQNWQRVLDMDSENPEALFHFGQLAMEQGRFAEARTYLDRAVHQEPFNLKFRFFQGMNLKQAGNHEEAQKVWESARGFLNPQDPYGSRIQRALAGTSGSVAPDSPAATFVATSPSAFDPSGPTAVQPGILAGPKPPIPGIHDPVYQSALEAARSGRMSEAIIGFQTALSTNPQNLNALINLGNAFTAMDRHGDAAVQYIRALQLSNGNHYSTQALDKALEELGIRGKARMGLAGKLPIGGGTGRERSNPRGFEPLARAFIDHGLAAEALPFVECGLEENPEQAALIVLRGEILGKQGQTQLAEADLRKALEMDKQNPLPYVKLGDLYAATQRQDLALEQYQAALKARFIDPDTMFVIHDRLQQMGRSVDAVTIINRLRGMNLSNVQLEKLKERRGTL